MSLTILGKTKDLRTNTHVIYAQINIVDYLNLVGENFDDFEIQRKRQAHKAYKRMREDIKQGALLPTITLAVKLECVDEILTCLDDEKRLKNYLSRSGQVNILDGLQRTFTLNDIKNEGFEFNPEQRLLLEFWLERDEKHLIYRLIVLNAGQKPMSMRHQVELLFSTIKEKLELEIDGLSITTERENSRRSMPKKYSLDRLVSAYQCYLTKNADIKKDNIVANNMLESKMVDSDEEMLDEKFQNFKEYLRVYAELDRKFYENFTRVTLSDGCVAPASNHWFAEENVMVAFFAAISDFSLDENRKARVDTALGKLLSQLENRERNSHEILGLRALTDILKGINTKRVNIGSETRKIMVSGFKEFFREEGEKSLSECWLSGV